MFPQTPLEFTEIYVDGKCVQVTMTTEGAPPEGDWKWYAKKYVAGENEDVTEYDMWFRVVSQ